MIKTRLASAAAAFLFGLAAIASTVLTSAPSANASSGAPSANGSSGAHSPHISEPKHTGPKTGPKIGQPFSHDPYPEANPFPSLSENPWQ
jgi:hypothetical protein